MSHSHLHDSRDALFLRPSDVTLQSLLRRAPRPVAIAATCLLLAGLTACGGRQPEEPESADSYIRCLADRVKASVTCTDVSTLAKPVLDLSGTAIILAAQHGDVELRVSDVVWSRDSVSFSAAVRNLVGQAIGTVDGRTPDPRGLVLRMVDVSADLDTARTAATRAAPTAALPTQLSWKVLAMLDSGEVSGAVRITLRTTPDAASAMFGLTVTAPVAHPLGFMRVQPATVAERGSVRLRAVRMDVRGREAVLQPEVRWRVMAGEMHAAVSSAGEMTGRLAGMVTVVAACEEPCSATPDTVSLAVTDEAGVTLSVDPASRHAISPYIYGVNFLTDDGDAMRSMPPWYGAAVPAGVTLSRLGGNRYSAYNWRTNFSNAGADYRHQNDRYLDSTTTPGEAVRRRVAAAAARGAATLVTIPMLPFVAADDEGVPLDTLGSTRERRLAAHFVPNRPAPRPGDAPGMVYQSEFVRWLDSTMRARGDSQPVFWSLDNEPDIWHVTHSEIMSDSAGKPRKQTYDGFAATSIAFAGAVKATLPHATVFGPATATWAGIATLGQTPDKDPVHGSDPFLEVYLDRFREAEATSGRRLLDVLDVHWYPEMGERFGGITNEWVQQDTDIVNTRLQAPRSLWDSTYDEQSWVSRVTGGAIALIPRLRRMIDGHYPGTALSISEYFYGRAGDISGGLAQADALGIFGREGLFAATMWPQGAPGAYDNDGARTYAYALGAFRLFRNYDGAGGSFGSTGLGAWSSDRARASIYASRRGDGRLVLVVINKTRATLPATVPMMRGAQPKVAQAWTMREGAPVPSQAPGITMTPGQALTFRMPPLSATTLVLDP